MALQHFFYNHDVRMGNKSPKCASNFLTLKSFSLGDTNDVDVLILGKHSLNRHRLLHMITDEVHLIGDAATIHLDLHDVSFLLALLQQLGLK